MDSYPTCPTCAGPIPRDLTEPYCPSCDQPVDMPRQEQWLPHD